ncbi:MAG: substrate-binding domain-containing protein, partial [Bacillota bacterium]|nr:substrate-binding domain-containing protein [Bacillota bacterium]
MSKRINIGIITKYTGNCYHGALLQAIHQAVAKNNVNITIINTFMIYRFCQEKEQDSSYYKIALNHIDGWIILSEGASSHFIEMLQKTGKPIITIGFFHQGIECSYVLEDSMLNAQLATEHLIKHGHKDIVFIGCSFLFDMMERFEGYKRALFKNGILFNPSLFINANTTMAESSKSLIQEEIKKGSKFTAIFAANDFLAIGAMEAIKEAGLKIPDDVAVIGYDDTSYAKSSNPALTSVRQDLTGMGTQAVEFLIKAINNKNISKEQILVKSDLILRKSCGCKLKTDVDNEMYKVNVNFKDTMVGYLEDEIGRTYSVASEMLTIDLSHIKKLMPLIVDSNSIQCIGFWDSRAGMESDSFIQYITDAKSQIISAPNAPCPIEDFPPQEFLSNLNNFNCDNVLWLLPITTSSRDWCIISYISPMKVNSLFAFDSSIILYNLLGIFLEHEMADTEKMASIGRLVTGVAHEINTPIGVSVTAASYIHQSSIKMMELFKTGKIKRSEMLRYLELSAESSELLLSSLNKASDLVNTFKQIAVEQPNVEKIRFNVKEYLTKAVFTLISRYEKNRLVVYIDCPDDLEINNYLNGLYQIFSNLINNSFLHAYNEDESGAISIKVFKDGNAMKIIYADNGKGISKNDLNKIFDPFYTTKRGSG